MSKSDDIFEEPASAKPAAKVAADPAYDADAPILSAAEIRGIKDEARANILKAKKADAKKVLLASEEQRLRNEEGLTTGNGHLDQMVGITIDLAQFAPYILINSQAYWHGRTYTVPRHVADTLRDCMWNTWKHQAEIDGKSKSAFYAEKHIAELYKPGNKGTVLSAAA